MMVFGAYTLVEHLAEQPELRHSTRAGKCYEVRDPLDLAVVAAAITGACFGFLWWNASPAQIFMGDTGSLSLGGALAGFAIMTRTELLLVILGGLFVVDHAVGDPPGRLLQGHGAGRPKHPGRPASFRMAPLHHHFELLGWEQVTIVIRFWIITGLCVAAGLGIFYAEWVAGTMNSPRSIASDRHDAWDGVRAVVAGFGVSGFAAADNLIHLGAARRRARRVDQRRASAEKAELLGGPRRRRSGSGPAPPRPCPTTSTSSSPRRAGSPTAPLLAQARRARHPGVGRGRAGLAAARPRRTPAPWLARHRHQRQDHDRADARRDPARRRAAQRRGRQRRPADRRGGDGPRAVRRARRRAVELPAALHALDGRRVGRRPQRRRGPPRLVHGPTAWPTTPPTRAASTSGVQRACVYNVADPETERLVREADVVEGARAIGFTLGMPAVGHGRRRRRHPGRPGLHRGARRPAPPSCARVDDLASPGARTSSPTPWPPPRWPARTASRQAAVRDGLRGFRPDGHRIADGRASVDGVTWVDDSKATNPHAAPVVAAWPTTPWCGSPAAWPRARRFDDLVAAVRGRLRGRRAARARPRRDRRRACATRARCAGHRRRRRRDWHRTCRHGARRSWPRPASPDRATRCCWPRAAPPWTCSPTTPTAATPSPRRCSRQLSD